MCINKLYPPNRNGYAFLHYELLCLHERSHEHNDNLTTNYTFLLYEHVLWDYMNHKMVSKIIHIGFLLSVSFLIYFKVKGKMERFATLITYIRFCSYENSFLYLNALGNIKLFLHYSDVHILFIMYSFMYVVMFSCVDSLNCLQRRRLSIVL